MTPARVFKSRRTGDWIVLYAPNEVCQRFPSWAEAFDHAFAWARVRHIEGNRA